MPIPGTYPFYVQRGIRKGRCDAIGLDGGIYVSIVGVWARVVYVTTG